MSTETLFQKLNRLRSERGEAATKEAFASFKSLTGKSGMLSVADQISALESPSMVKPHSAPAVSAAAKPAPIASAPKAVAPAPVVSATTAPVALHGREAVIAGVRSQLVSQGFKSLSKQHSPTPPEAKGHLTGKARVQKSIRDGLVSTGQTNISKA